MADALEGGFDLAGLALCFVALALLLVVRDVVSTVVGALDFSVFGVRPLHGLASGAQNAIVGAFNAAIKQVERVAAGFENGLIDSFGMLIAIPALLFLGVKAALEYLWHHALRPLVHDIVDPVSDVADEARTKAKAAAAAAAAAVTTAENYADGVGARAVDDAAAFTRREIAAAVATTERYADQAVATLRDAENAAIASVAQIASAAEGEAAAAVSAAIDAARAVAIPVEHELDALDAYIKSLGLTALVAAVPALATLLSRVLAETGLENEECRTKVKGICGTDPAAWGGLLASLALLTGTLSLRELVDFVRPLVKPAGDLIRQAA